MATTTSTTITTKTTAQTHMTSTENLITYQPHTLAIHRFDSLQRPSEIIFNLREISDLCVICDAHTSQAISYWCI